MYHNMFVIKACDILNALQVILFRLMNYACCYMYYLRHTSRVLLTSSIGVLVMIIDSVTLVRTDFPTMSRCSFSQSHIAPIIIGLYYRYRVIMISIHLALNTLVVAAN